MSKCGNEDCACSTGIHGGLTFGRGELSCNGYFSIPCRVCASDWDSKVEDRIKKYRNKFFQEGLTKQQIDDRIEEMEWLNLKAWPYN